MLNRIEEWRTKPVPQKRRYALTAAVVTTLVIAGMWASTLPTRLAVLDFDQAAAVIEAEEVEAERVPGIIPPAEPSRFSTFTANVMNGFAVVKNKLVGTPEEPAPPVVATTTPRAWTEVVDAKREPIIETGGKPIMIEVATTSATTTASTTEGAAATSTGDVIQ